MLLPVLPVLSMVQVEDILLYYRYINSYRFISFVKAQRKDFERNVNNDNFFNLGMFQLKKFGQSYLLHEIIIKYMIEMKCQSQKKKKKTLV